MNKRSNRNRLYDTRHQTRITAFRRDALFEKAVERLVELGYSGMSEIVYDSVYRQLNEMVGADIYPTLQLNKKKEDEADRELEKAINALKLIKTDLGVLSR